MRLTDLLDAWVVPVRSADWGVVLPSAKHVAWEKVWLNSLSDGIDLDTSVDWAVGRSVEDRELTWVEGALDVSSA